MVSNKVPVCEIRRLRRMSYRLDQAIRDGDETLVLELATLLKDNQQFIRPDVEYWKLSRQDERSDPHHHTEGI